MSVAGLVIVDLAVGLSPPWFMALAALGAVLDVPGASAREALISDVASASGTSLERLAGMRGGLFGAAFLIGPRVAGVLLGAVSDTVLLTGVAIASLCAAWLGTHIPDGAPASTEAGAGPPGGAWRTITADRTLRLLLVIAVGTTFASRPMVTILLPAHFQALGSPALLGLTLAAYAGGTAVGSGIFAASGHRLRTAWWIGANVVSAAGLAVLGWLPPTPWLVVTMVALGMAGAPIQSLTTVLLAEHTPVHRRGAVFAFFASTGLIAAPVALALTGVILQWTQLAHLSLAVCAMWGLVCLGSAAVVHRLFDPDAQRAQGSGT